MTDDAVGKISEAQKILQELGLPTAQQNEMSALVLLALTGVGPTDDWSEATRTRRGVTKEIMGFAAEAYGRAYAPNTRETFRRQVLHQFMQASLAEYNPFDPDLPTNSPRAHYAISEDALIAVKAFGTPAWSGAAAQFLAKHGSLAAAYAGHRSTGTLVPINLPDGSQVELSPGAHNLVQKAIIEEFGPRFASGSIILYLGDTAKKNIIMETDRLQELGFSANDHDKLPDVVLYQEDKNWLFLIEAVTSHGPMSPKRVLELQERFKDSSVGLVYVSAFPDMSEFRKHMRDVSWETEAWISEIPEHLIHFNGDRFLGPH